MKTNSPDAGLPPVLKLVCQVLDEKKAEDVRVLRVSEQSSITDYLVVATGTSDPHLRALRIEVEKVLDSNAVHIVGMDTTQESGWVVIDAFDIMIHMLNPVNRERYALENLWKDAEEIELGAILSPETHVPSPKPAKAKANARPKTPAKPRTKTAKSTRPSKSAKTAKPTKTPAKKPSARPPAKSRKRAAE